MKTKQFLTLILVLQCFGCSQNQAPSQVNDAQTNDSQVNDAQTNDSQVNDAQTNDSQVNDAQTDTSNPENQSAYEVVWRRSNTSHGAISQPILADLNLDGQKEILYSTSDGFQVKNYNYEDLPGWPQANSIANWFSYAVTNLDQDPKPEIVLVGYLGAGAFRIIVYHHDATPLVGWPQDFEDDGNRLAIALGDLAGDEKPEIIIRTVNHFIVWDSQGNLLPGWPQRFPDNHNCNFALGDLDQDRKLEIISSDLHTIIAWKGNSKIMPGFPVELIAPSEDFYFNCGNIVVGDLNNDSQLEIVKGTIHQTPSLEQRYYGMLWIVQSNGSIQTSWQVMPQSPEDYAFSKSKYVFPNALANLDHDQDLEIIAGAYAFHHDGQPVDGWPIQESLNFSTNERYTYQTIGDINGDGEMEIVNGVSYVSDNKTIVKIFSHNAQLLFRLITTNNLSSVIHTPIIDDLDNDGQMEIMTIVYTTGYYDFDSLSLWKFHSSIDNPKLEWPLPNHDPQNTNNYETPLQ